MPDESMDAEILTGISKNSISETLFSIKSISYSLQVVGIDNF